MDGDHNGIVSIAHLVGSRQPMNGKLVPDFLDCAMPMAYGLYGSFSYFILFLWSMNNYITLTRKVIAAIA